MSFGTEKRRLHKFLPLIVLPVLGVLVWGSPAAAVDSTVQVQIDDSTQSVLTIDLSTTTPTTVTSSPLRITGTVKHLNQIQVYVDGVAAGVVPLSIGATSFSVEIPLTVGSHVIRLIGISSSGSSDPVVSLQVVYAPARDSTTLPSRQGGGINTEGQLSPSQTIQPGSQGLPMPDWLRNGLMAVDFVRADEKGWSLAMLCRLVLIVLGLIMLLCARLVLRAYRRLRYGWLKWRKRPLSAVLRRRPLLVIRLIGLAIIMVVLWLF